MSTRASQSEYSSRQKGIAAVAVIAIVLAVVIVYKMWASTQVHVVRSLNLPPGSSEKMQAMKAQGQSRDEGASDNINPGQMQHR